MLLFADCVRVFIAFLGDRVSVCCLQEMMSVQELIILLILKIFVLFFLHIPKIHCIFAAELGMGIIVAYSIARRFGVEIDN